MVGKEPSFSVRVHRLVRRIPAGRVSSYGEIAERLGSPRGARGVASALSALPEGTDVPWWRVVNARGQISLSGAHASLQRSLLQADGVVFGRGRRIDLRAFAWSPDPPRS